MNPGSTHNHLDAESITLNTPKLNLKRDSMRLGEDWKALHVAFDSGVLMTAATSSPEFGPCAKSMGGP